MSMPRRFHSRKPVFFGALLAWLLVGAATPADQVDDLFRRSNQAIEVGDYDLGIALARQILRIDPRQPGAYVTIAWGYSAKGDYPKAIEMCNTALSSANIGRDDEATAYNNRGMAYAALGNFRKALDDFERSIRLDPKNSKAYGNSAFIRATCPESALRDKRKAFTYANRGYELAGQDAFALFALAAAYAENNDFEQAVTWQKKAIAKTRDRNDSVTYRARLKCYERKEPFRNYNDVAWALATNPDESQRNGPLALVYAKRALALEPENPSLRGTLAAAYAEVGNWDEAVKAAQQALTMTDPAATSLVRINRTQLKRYQQRKPFRMGD